jgi:acetyl/propionyl-CoA carboxylase alpha subunit/acetyl-CoA carboxylase carboxyltransferase component
MTRGRQPRGPQVTTIHRLAVANRGEAAMRCLSAVAELNCGSKEPIETIALCTEPDLTSWFAREATEAVSLGPATFTDDDGSRQSSYLDLDRVMAALVGARADAVWVGWGFVAESAEFAERCERAGITFVGPPSDVIRLLGNKVSAKQLAEKAGIPVVPWSGGPVSDARSAAVAAGMLGYPVLVKAAAGGGGRGIRLVETPDGMDAAVTSAQAEARHSFGNPALFVERRLTAARHVEVQVIADAFGTVWAVGVRDCSIQRRNQKVIEESGCTLLDEAAAKTLRDAAVRLCTVAGYRGAGTVEFLLDPVTKQFMFMEVNTRLQVEHPVTEMTTGLDLVKLQLHVASGKPLTGEPPPANGYAIEARLNAEDPEHAFAPAPGRVSALRLPTGPGMRVDTGVTEGDMIAPEFDSMIAKLIAWGHDRHEALGRLHRGLAQAIVVVDGGTTNKAFLLVVTGRPEVAEGTYDNQWLDRRMAAEDLLPAHHPVALLVAAVEAAEADQAAVQANFYAAAARGRPQLPDTVGHRMDLRLGGNSYRLHAYCLGPGDYRVDAGQGLVDLNVRQLGRYERAVTCGGRRHRVVADAQGPRLMIEVDGVSHTVYRDDGGLVRTSAPAFVVGVRVAPGDLVRAGDPLVVVESMKMETTITAPFAGTVRAVTAGLNTQVDAGAPVVQLQAINDQQGETGEPRIDLVGFAGTAADDGRGDHGHADRAPTATLRAYLMGYDLDEATARTLSRRQESVLETAEPVDPDVLREEQDLLELFADISELSRREPDDPEDEHSRSDQEYFFTYLAFLDLERSGVPGHFVTQLRRALARYGVTSTDRTPDLERALLRMYRSLGRLQTVAPAIMSILDRWRQHREQLAAAMTDERLSVLDRLIASARGRQQQVGDLASEVRFDYVDAPLIRQAHDQVYAAMDGCLDELAVEQSGKRHAELTAQLVWCPQPMRAALRDRYRAADAATRARLLEVRARRFYRIRDLASLRCETFGRYLTCLATYNDGASGFSSPYLADRAITGDGAAGADVCLVSTYVPLDELPAFASELRAHLRTIPADQQVVVDVESWRSSSRIPGDAMAVEIAALLAQADFGRSLYRFDITVTSESAEGEHAQEHLRTQHFSFTGSDPGFAEEPLYRNLHPMIAERLNLWRLSNFKLERLPSAEDIYLFHAVAHENAKDERLIALAEVRDLTPARGAAGNIIGYPVLECQLKQSLADIRHALGARPPQQRPRNNRLVLYVRPTWNIPPGIWRGLAHKLAPMVAGLSLEKVSVRIRTQDGANGEVHGAVLDIENVADRAVTVRERQPVDQPIRPLTEYKQKLQRAQRIGAPYPYELIRMLTPPLGAEADLPAGDFIEHDLDGTGDRLIPVDRLYGRNECGIVVGVITNYTKLIPEGMRRVVILGDPTLGLGNLTEKECRRILAALDLAAEMDVPVEWFALSSGARIAWDSGTENMDWIAAVLRRIVNFTQAGGEINIIVTGINVGAQPYWDAEATMLMHTRGILIMTPVSAMVLTGKSSLDFSGGVSAEDNIGIGGFERIMGPNGQGQYWAPTLADACALLLRHYDHTYIVPGETHPRRASTTDPYDRDVSASPHRKVEGSEFEWVGDIFSAELNGERKKPFDMRSVMRAVSDSDYEPFERWARWHDAETAIVWDARIGGIPVCLIGLESQTLPRAGFLPADGPSSWTSGTLFPQSSRKVARAINAANGNRPLVVLANLTGFDGSPESMRLWQLEYGAEIGRGITNFRGPIVFVVVSRYHGGAFVVFSKRLNDNMGIAAVAGSYASVIGGAPAAGVVLVREVYARTEKDPRIAKLRDQLAAASGGDVARVSQELGDATKLVKAEKLKECADEFDAIHDIKRAMRVGSVDEIISAAELRPYIIKSLEQRLAALAPAVLADDRVAYRPQS